MQDEIRVHISRRARLNIETKKKNYAHRMVPEYTIEGELDYHLLLENLNDWIGEHLRSSADVLIVQASVHDIHLGSLEEYPAHINRLALYLSQVNARVFFRSGDALHMPPAHILKSTRCSDFYMVYGH